MRARKIAEIIGNEHVLGDDERLIVPSWRDFVVRIPLAEWTETDLPRAISYKSRALFARLIRRRDPDAPGRFSIVSAYIDLMPYSVNP